MRFLKYCFALILFTIAFSAANAQQRDLLISFRSPPPSTIDTSEDPAIYVKIENVDTLNYSGQFTYRYTVNGSLGVNSTVSGLDSGLEYDTTITAFLLPGDSIFDTIIVHPSPPFFTPGPTVVVIWPIRVNGNFFRVVDSAEFYFNITELNGTNINEPDLGRMYYSNGRLFYYNESEVRLTHVRIIGLSGATIAHIAVANDQYTDIPDLPCGMYIAEAILSNNRRIAFKFIPSLH